MPEPSPRLPCPVCLGTTMEKVAVGRGGALQIDHCRRCGGVWLEHGEIQQLRAVKKNDVWKHVEPQRLIFLMRCHDCHAPIDRADEACPACGWTNQLDCPACERPMSVEAHAGLRLDLCRDCKGVWFDRHELAAVWGASFDRALQKRALPRGSASAAVADGTAGHAFFEAVLHTPELVFHGVHAAGASAELAAQLPEAVAATPEAAAAVFEAAGEAAGSVFEVVVQIIGGILEGL